MSAQDTVLLVVDAQEKLLESTFSRAVGVHEDIRVNEQPGIWAHQVCWIEREQFFGSATH